MISEQTISRLRTLNAQFENAPDDGVRNDIAKEAVDLVLRDLIREMINRHVTPRALAILGVQQFARHFGSGQVFASGGTVSLH